MSFWKCGLPSYGGKIHFFTPIATRKTGGGNAVNGPANRRAGGNETPSKAVDTAVSRQKNL